ncbi:MAG: hypothetical protein V2A34_02385 [Lentisphaerota bacterium]
MHPKKAIAYYITAHGYGHGVRSCDVIRSLNERHPQHPVVLISDLPESFLRSRLASGQNRFRRGSFDVGMVQLDSIRVDVPATLRELEVLYTRHAGRVREEKEFLQSIHAGVVVSDIPAIPLEAAASCSMPCLAMGNFSWDWIYASFASQDPRWGGYVEKYRTGYALADLLLKLPLSPEMPAFPLQEEIPLVASPGRERRSDIAKLTGCDPRKKWVLLSFTTLDWNEEALRHIEQLDTYEFFTVKPLEWIRKNIYSIDHGLVSFSDVLASVDIVVSKPGFGLISECILNRKPLVFADRSDFVEYDVLVAGIQKFLKNLHIPSADLYQGDLAPSLEAVMNQPEPRETLLGGGAELAAGRIVEYLMR